MDPQGIKKNINVCNICFLKKLDFFNIFFEFSICLMTLLWRRRRKKKQNRQNKQKKSKNNQNKIIHPKNNFPSHKSKSRTNHYKKNYVKEKCFKNCFFKPSANSQQ
jgi:uncharacterized membrane protein